MDKRAVKTRDHSALRMEERNFPIEEAAEVVNCSRSYFYAEFIGKKKVKIAKLGSRSVVPGVELRRLIEIIAASAT